MAVEAETGTNLPGLAEAVAIGPRSVRARLTPEERARHEAFLATLGKCQAQDISVGQAYAGGQPG